MALIGVGGRAKIGTKKLNSSVIVDRIEGNKAVIKVPADNQTLVVPLSALPKGTKEGSHLRAAIYDDRFFWGELDTWAETTARNRITAKKAALKSQGQSIK